MPQRLPQVSREVSPFRTAPQMLIGSEGVFARAVATRVFGVDDDGTLLETYHWNLHLRGGAFNCDSWCVSP